MISINYIDKNSFFHNLDSRSKMVWLIATTLSAIFISNPHLLVLLFIHVIIVGITARMPAGRLLKENIRWGVIIFAISLLFSALDLSNLYHALAISLLVTIKWLTIISSGIIFSTATNPQDIVSGLVKLKFPRAFAFSVGMGMRSLVLMRTEVGRIFSAQRARGFNPKPSFRDIHKLHHKLSPVIIPMLVSVIRLSNEIATALDSKGFSMETVGDSPFVRIRPSDIAVIALSIALFALVVWLRFLF